MHLNPDKIKIDVDAVPFFGQTLTKNGLQMDEKKWEVIQQWPAAKTVKELQSFLGSVNYLPKFIPYLSNIRKPLQDLLKADDEFTCKQLTVHDDAFNKLKSAIVKDMTLKYFNPRLPIYIETDASKKGIGVMLMQPDSVVQNTSTHNSQQSETSILCI